jgi:hypothetical protein
MEVFVPETDQETIHGRFHLMMIFKNFTNLMKGLFYQRYSIIFIFFICILEQPKLIFNNTNLYTHMTILNRLRKEIRH